MSSCLGRVESSGGPLRPHMINEDFFSLERWSTFEEESNQSSSGIMYTDVVVRTTISISTTSTVNPPIRSHLQSLTSTLHMIPAPLDLEPMIFTVLCHPPQIFSPNN